jgi:hypothetical protein
VWPKESVAKSLVSLSRERFDELQELSSGHHGGITGRGGYNNGCIVVGINVDHGVVFFFERGFGFRRSNEKGVKDRRPEVGTGSEEVAELGEFSTMYLISSSTALGLRSRVCWSEMAMCQGQRTKILEFC